MQTIDVLQWWDAAWDEGLWYAPWSKAIDGLTAAQAAWTPAPGRHSIWAILNHMCFWREHALRVLRNDRPSKEEVEKRNFETPADVSEAAWAAARQRFATLQAHLALAGFSLIRAGDGHYVIARWNETRRLDTLEEVEQFHQRVAP